MASRFQQCLQILLVASVFGLTYGGGELTARGHTPTELAGYDENSLTLSNNTTYSHLKKLVESYLNNQTDNSNVLMELIFDNLTGFDLNEVIMTNNFSTSLINLATLENNTDLTELLLKAGADAYQADSDGNTALHNAVLKKNGEIVTYIIQNNTVGINKENKMKETAIFISARLNETEIFMNLLEKGADPNVGNSGKETALHLASALGNIDICLVILNTSTDSLNEQTEAGVTPFYLAAIQNRTEICRLLIEKGAQPRSQIRSRETFLQELARRGNLEIVELILEKDNSVINRQDNNGSTELLLAAKESITELCRILIKRGANPLIRNIYNRTALHEAAIVGNLDIIKLIINETMTGINFQDVDGATPFLLAFQRRATKIWIALLFAGAEPYMTDYENDTPLHETAALGDLEAVHVLLNRSLKYIDTNNFEGKTPLHLAAYHNHSQVVRALLMRGADPYLVDYDGRTALHVSARHNFLQIVKYLLESGKELVNIQDNNWQTALHLATVQNNFLIFIFLIEYGAVLFPDRNGWLPLHHAAGNGNTIFLDSMLLRNASINFQNYAGNTALHVAAQLRRDNKTTRLLLHYGADPRIKNYEGQTALHIAAKFGNTGSMYEILKYANKVILNELDFNGHSPLYVATDSSRNALQMLLEENSDLFVFPENYDTPLHAAMSKEDIDLVNLILLKFPGIINNLGAGYTPILKALLLNYCNVPLITYLLEKGANILVISDRGENIFHLAAVWCPEEIFEILYRKAEKQLKARGKGEYFLVEFINWVDILGRTPLMNAASRDNEEAFFFFLRKGSNIEHINSFGCSIMVEAGRGGNTRIIKEVLNKTIIPVNDKCYDGMTALMAAANDGNGDAFELLLQNGAKLDETNAFENTVLHYAVSGVYARDSIINRTLESPETNVDARDVEDFTPLMLAVQSWNYNAVQLLLKQGADQLMKNIYGETSIIFAIREGDFRGNFDFKRRGLSKYFTYDADFLLGMVLTRQRKWHDNQLLKDLLDRSSIKTYPIFHAAATGNHTEVSRLLSVGASRNPKKFPTIMKALLVDYNVAMTQLLTDDNDEYIYQSRMTLLDISLLFFGNINTIKKLVDELRLNCSSLNYRKQMWTTLDFSIFAYERAETRYSNSGILHYLFNLCNCCLSKSTNEYSWTLAHKAAWANNIIGIQYLHQYNVDLDKPDIFGRTPLHIASLHGNHMAMVQLFHFTKKSVNAKDIHGFTPLHLAQIFQYKKFFERLSTATVTLPFIEKYKFIQRFIKFSRESREAEGYRRASMFLVDNGADLNIQDRAYGWTALHWASAAGSLDNVALLISKGACVNIESWNKETPMAVARTWGRISVYNYLKAKNGVW